MMPHAHAERISSAILRNTDTGAQGPFPYYEYCNTDTGAQGPFPYYE